MEDLPGIKAAIKKYSPKDKDHFTNGWQMYPEWWSKSSESWKLGFLAKQIYMDPRGNL